MTPWTDLTGAASNEENTAQTHREAGVGWARLLLGESAASLKHRCLLSRVEPGGSVYIELSKEVGFGVYSWNEETGLATCGVSCLDREQCSGCK